MGGACTQAFPAREAPEMCQQGARQPSQWQHTPAGPPEGWQLRRTLLWQEEQPALGCPGQLAPARMALACRGDEVALGDQHPVVRIQDAQVPRPAVGGPIKQHAVVAALRQVAGVAPRAAGPGRAGKARDRSLAARGAALGADDQPGCTFMRSSPLSVAPFPRPHLLKVRVRCSMPLSTMPGLNAAISEYHVRRTAGEAKQGMADRADARDAAGRRGEAAEGKAARERSAREGRPRGGRPASRRHALCLPLKHTASAAQGCAGGPAPADTCALRAGNTEAGPAAIYEACRPRLAAHRGAPGLGPTL